MSRPGVPAEVPAPRMLVDGKLVEAGTGASYPILDPATGLEIGRAPDASAADMDTAIAAARRAFDETGWATDLELRVRCLRQLHRALVEHAPAFQALTTAEMGAPAFLMSGPQYDIPAGGVAWSADLAESNNTTIEGAPSFLPEGTEVSPTSPFGKSQSPYGRILHFGIREHAMGAICNGLSLCKVRPYGSGFLIFSDYGRNPLRLAAIMEIPVIYAFTHDSIGVGEDGPTHQPVEQVAALRGIPGLIVLRPADAAEATAGPGCRHLRAAGRPGGGRRASARRS